MPIRKAPPTAGHFGQGVAYPPAYDDAGRLTLSWGTKSVDDAMSAIVQTAPGERVMQPDNGSAVGVHDPIRDVSFLTQTIRQNVAEHEPRVDPDSIEVEIQQIDASGKLEITVFYRPNGEANARTLTAPYFGVT